VVVLLLCFFFLYQTHHATGPEAPKGFVAISTLIVLLLASFFLVNFMVKKNGLTKDSSYTILFFLLFLLVFPAVFSNTNLLFANFFLLLSLRRLMSLQTLKAPKEKIFDASMWIFIACLFHFWCILFLLLVYISIVFHVSRDFRNWLLPFVAFVATGVVFVVAALVFDPTWIDHFRSQMQMNFELNYFTTNFQNAALSFYIIVALYFALAMILSMTNRPLNLQASYKKMIFAFIIGTIVFLISPQKQNVLLLFTFMPLSLMGTNNLEYSQNKLYKEIVLLLLIVGSLIAFFVQL
jgi:hypothetical protein